MENIRNIVEQILNLKVISVTQLSGGMSNYNYKVTTAKHDLVVRVPGKKASKFVDRRVEMYHLELIKHLSINQEVIYFDKESGLKISRYIDGVMPETFDLDEITSLFKSYHVLDSVCDYKPFEKLSKFASYTDRQSPSYFNLYNKLLEYRKYLMSQLLVFCHNDSQPFNFVDDGSKLHLLDWEFAGNNDPIYDLVCFGEDYGADDELTDKLIEKYFGYIDFDLIKRKLLWTIFQCLQWYNVALYKDEIGLGEELDIDFKEVCDYFISKSHEKFEELEKLENENNKWFNN